MWKRPKYYRAPRDRSLKKPLFYGLLFIVAAALFSFTLKSLFSNITDRTVTEKSVVASPEVQRMAVLKTKREPRPRPEPAPAPLAERESPQKPSPWEGPILYYKGTIPVHFILVEKKTQKLFVYRYDGSYKLLATYPCATGENRGGKWVEGDKKTPDGIYFSNKVHRDSKVTIFGDRAFGLNYPNVFDNIAGRGGSGIFIHGSNKGVPPFSTRGCVALDNKYLAELDRFIEMDKTPIIIGYRLPYLFTSEGSGINEIIPFLEMAMIPKENANNSLKLDLVAVFGFKDRMVALGEANGPQKSGPGGTSRIYLAKPGARLAILLKREWTEKPAVVASLPKKSGAGATAPAAEDSGLVSLVESWRQAWQGKKLDTYISHYHPSFKSTGKDLGAWKRHKKSLNRRYRTISVKVNDLKVKVSGKKAWAFFKQGYRSDSYRAGGYKLLTFKRSGESWKIVKEVWFPKKPRTWP